MDANSEQIKTRLVIFDLDGTLLDTIEDLAQSVNSVLREHGYPTHDIEQYKSFVGNGITSLIRRALPTGLGGDDGLVARLQADFVEFYSRHGRDNTRPYEGIVELLAELERRGVARAVASNKHHPATLALVDFYFGVGAFSVVFGKREGVAAKPDPTIVRDILEQCGVSAGEVLYVGDSDTDMETARNAGVRSVGVTWGFRTCEELVQSGAWYLIDAPGELLELLW